MFRGMTHTPIHSRHCLVIALLAASALTLSSRAEESSALIEQAQTAVSAKAVRSEVAPRIQIVSRDLKGSFAQHPAALAELRRYLSNVKADIAGPAMGIYPMDPDVVPARELQWQVAVPVASATRLRAPYALRVLPSTEIVALDSSVAESHHDGLFLKKWVIDNGFVQTAPTRMLFHDLDNPNPMAVKTTIVFPVKRREVMPRLLKQPGR